MVGAAAALHNLLCIHKPMKDLEDDKEHDVEGDPFLAGGGNDEDVVAGHAVDNTEKVWADMCRDRIAQAM